MIYNSFIDYDTLFQPIQEYCNKNSLFNKAKNDV